MKTLEKENKDLKENEELKNMKTEKEIKFIKEFINKTKIIIKTININEIFENPFDFLLIFENYEDRIIFLSNLLEKFFEKNKNLLNEKTFKELLKEIKTKKLFFSYFNFLKIIVNLKNSKEINKKTINIFITKYIENFTKDINFILKFWEIKKLL